MREIKKRIINILDLNSKTNLGITRELYRIFNELSTECFNDHFNHHKRLLCYDQLCIWLDSINDNVCNVMLMKNLTCTIYESGLCDVRFE
jgi:hypothetical protein